MIAILKQNTLAKVFSLNALSTLVRMLAGMISVKVIALIIGPSGVALVGQLTNLSTIIYGIANGGINNGITKYIAENKSKPENLKKIISNATRISLICSLITAFVLIVGCRYFSRITLFCDDYWYVFLIFGIALILFVSNSLLLSVLNGLKRFEKYVTANIIGTVISLISAVFLVLLWGLPGALINVVTCQSIIFFSTLWVCRKETWLHLSYFSGKTDNSTIKDYLRYSAMTITTLSLYPVSQMFLRGFVITEISPTEAGWWEAMNRISGMYLNVVTSAFSIYYLPRLSEISDKRELHDEICKCFKFVLPLLITACMLIYILRRVIIWILFTPEFYPMEDLFVWQLLGDVFKISSWLLAFLMVAKAKTKLFISTEIAFTLSYACIAFLCLNNNGIVGLTQGYLINYILYFLTMLWLFRSVVFLPKK